MLCHLGHKHPDQDHLEAAPVEVVLEFMPWRRTSHQVEEEEEEGRWMIKGLSSVAWIGKFFGKKHHHTIRSIGKCISGSEQQQKQQQRQQSTALDLHLQQGGGEGGGGKLTF